MNEDFVRISKLINLLLNGKINTEEKKELNAWVEKYPQLKEWILNTDKKREEIQKSYTNYIKNNLLQDWKIIESRSEGDTARDRNKNYRWLLAASVLFLAIIGILFMRKKDKAPSQLPVAMADSAPVLPGSSKAYLVLSNGKTVKLGNENTRIEEKGNLILKVEKSILKYPEVAANVQGMNKIKVPLGGIYQVQLSDGTNVWLNSDSELEYPCTFGAKERNVALKGEAYFEVARDAGRPFRVSASGTVIEAVGTEFNVNTQLQKGVVKAILTKGKIRVSDQNDSRVISPGFATFSGEDGPIRIQKADVREALAWKEGYFYFNNKDLNQILADIVRWYNVKLKVEAPVSNDTYQGEIKRAESIETVCRMIQELSGYTILIHNRTITVKK